MSNAKPIAAMKQISHCVIVSGWAGGGSRSLDMMSLFPSGSAGGYQPQVGKRGAFRITSRRWFVTLDVCAGKGGRESFRGGVIREARFSGPKRLADSDRLYSGATISNSSTAG